MRTNDKNPILYFDLNLISEMSVDKVGYIKDESEIASTLTEGRTGDVAVISEPVVVFDKKSGLFNRVKVTPYGEDIADIERVPVDIDTRSLDTFIDRIVLVFMGYWGSPGFRAFVTTEEPSSIYRTMLEFSRLMEYINPDEKVDKNIRELTRILGPSSFSVDRIDETKLICLHADSWDAKSLSDVISYNNIEDVLIIQRPTPEGDNRGYLAYFNGEEIEAEELYDRYVQEALSVLPNVTVMDSSMDEGSYEYRLISFLIKKLNCSIVVKMPNPYSE